MQDPIQFDVCGIYHLNLQTLAGVRLYKPKKTVEILYYFLYFQMFFFILEALVIFLQFVSLVGPNQSWD